MLAVLALLAVQAAPAPAPSPAPLTPEQADARCLAALGSLASSDNAEAQRAAQLGALYFYGKLLGRNPAVALQPVLTEAATAILADPRPELARCGGELQRSGETLKAVGAALRDGTPAATPTPDAKP